jgi:hypothetical protein
MFVYVFSSKSSSAPQMNKYACDGVLRWNAGRNCAMSVCVLRRGVYGLAVGVGAGGAVGKK